EEEKASKRCPFSSAAERQTRAQVACAIGAQYGLLGLRCDSANINAAARPHSQVLYSTHDSEKHETSGKIMRTPRDRARSDSRAMQQRRRSDATANFCRE